MSQDEKINTIEASLKLMKNPVFKELVYALNRHQLTIIRLFTNTLLHQGYSNDVIGAALGLVDFGVKEKDVLKKHG